MKLLITTTILLCFVSSAFGYEDPRWERSGQPVKRPSNIQQQPQQAVSTGQNVGKEDALSKYEEEKLRRNISALKESPMPLRLPDIVLRVMFLPYVDSKNVLRNSYYAFMKVEDGKWVLGEYLTAPITQKQVKGRVFTPLSVSLPVQPDEDKDKDKEKTEVKKEGNE